MKKYFNYFLAILFVAVFGGCGKPTIPPCDDKTVLSILKEELIKDFKTRCDPKNQYDIYCYIKDGKFKNPTFMDLRRKYEGCIVNFIADYEETSLIMTYKTRYDESGKISVEAMDNVSKAISNIF